MNSNTTNFALVRVPNYYAGTYNAPQPSVIALGTVAECVAAIPDMSGIYHLGHGEAGRPTWEVREVVAIAAADACGVSAWDIADIYGRDWAEIGAAMWGEMLADESPERVERAQADLARIAKCFGISVDAPEAQAEAYAEWCGPEGEERLMQAALARAGRQALQADPYDYDMRGYNGDIFILSAEAVEVAQ